MDTWTNEVPQKSGFYWRYGPPKRIEYGPEFELDLVKVEIHDNLIDFLGQSHTQKTFSYIGDNVPVGTMNYGDGEGPWWLHLNPSVPIPAEILGKKYEGRI